MLASRYTIGYEPYDKRNDDSGMYYHPELARKLIQKVLETNKESLPDQLIQLLKKGLEKDGQLVWNEFLSQVLQQKQIPVLIAIDQINFFYSKTDYYDTESNILTADRFEMVKTWLNILKTKQNENIKMVVAQDGSDFLHSAPLFSSLISKTAHEFHSLDSAGVVLNSQLDPTVQDPFPSELLPEKVDVFGIEPLSKQELESWVSFYKDHSLLRSGMFDLLLCEYFKSL